MDLRYSESDEAFRRELRAWLADAVPAHGPAPSERSDWSLRREYDCAWQRRLYDAGYAGINWPKEYGGRDASLTEQLVYYEETARARAPYVGVNFVGLLHGGPTIMAEGTPEQKQRHIGPIVRGEQVWCQGFSEPGAGSDLASLRTRGEVRGDEIVVTGQKIWTSFAHFADWCILVVRTDPEAPRKHDGITFLLVDMKSPGIRIRPLREMTGEDWFNEVFFDGVRVPRRNAVGEIGGGWEIIVDTLSHERASAAPHARLEAEIEALRRLARRAPRGAGVAAEDPRIRQLLARAVIEVTTLRLNAYRNADTIARRGLPGPMGSTLKLGWSELDQRVKQLAAEMLGPSALLGAGDPCAVDDGYWSHELLWSRAATLYAGTSEIQRNIIAERVLGLPR